MQNQEQFPNKQELKDKYLSKIDKDGYLDLTNARSEFGGRQIQYIASFLDGGEGTEPEYNYGKGLRYKGTSGNYSDMKIHIDDLETFVKLVKKHYGDK
jgi:hypothetical protein